MIRFTNFLHHWKGNFKDKISDELVMKCPAGVSRGCVPRVLTPSVPRERILGVYIQKNEF